jgi:peptide-methionine (S)-S-oxide reductase
MKRLWLALWMGVMLMNAHVQAEPKVATAILAGGCFWCVQTDMEKLPGVIKAVSGYTGGASVSPTYQNYHDGAQPHVEAVQVRYDSAKLSYATLLDYYFRHVDPTDGEGQFCDRGPAYRPVIFVATDEERKIAETKKLEVAGILKQPIKVDVLTANAFWPAEEYHQDYHAKNPTKYTFYRWNCGRDQRVKALWGRN